MKRILYACAFLISSACFVHAADNHPLVPIQPQENGLVGVEHLTRAFAYVPVVAGITSQFFIKDIRTATCALAGGCGISLFLSNEFKKLFTNEIKIDNRNIQADTTTSVIARLEEAGVVINGEPTYRNLLVNHNKRHKAVVKILEKDKIVLLILSAVALTYKFGSFFYGKMQNN